MITRSEAAIPSGSAAATIGPFRAKHINAKTWRGPLTLRCWAGIRAAKSLSNVQEVAATAGVCLVRSRRNDAFFCDPEALVLSHPIGCIVEKTGAVLHCIKCT